jgi:hypothetical protein
MGAREQAVYDAIKRCRVDGEAWVTFGDKRLHLVPTSTEVWDTFWALVKSRRPGGVALAQIILKDGLRIQEEGGPNRRGGDKDLLAIVESFHPRS